MTQQTPNPADSNAMKEFLAGAARSGRFMFAGFFVENGKLEYRMTCNDFPDADMPNALKTWKEDCEKLAGKNRENAPPPQVITPMGGAPISVPQPAAPPAEPSADRPAEPAGSGPPPPTPLSPLMKGGS